MDAKDGDGTGKTIGEQGDPARLLRAAPNRERPREGMGCRLRVFGSDPITAMNVAGSTLGVDKLPEERPIDRIGVAAPVPQTFSDLRSDARRYVGQAAVAPFHHAALGLDKQHGVAENQVVEQVASAACKRYGR